MSFWKTSASFCKTEKYKRNKVSQAMTKSIKNHAQSSPKMNTQTNQKSQIIPTLNF